MGSNLGPTSKALADRIRPTSTSSKAGEPVGHSPGRSGDHLRQRPRPGHLARRPRYFQVPRIAKARGLPEERVRDLVDSQAEGRTFGLLGEPRVNVLKLNLALDALKS